MTDDKSKRSNPDRRRINWASIMRSGTGLSISTSPAKNFSAQLTKSATAQVL